MDDQTRKNPPEVNVMQDLPPKQLGKDVEENVKGGSEPVNDLRTKSPSPVEPINGGR
jgi:hypothetical protein